MASSPPVQLQLYDARQDAVIPVRNLDPDRPVTVYICGITPYDTTHLGHAFTYAVGDHLIRTLELLGYRVRYVQNVTDIDDDILRKASEEGENWKTLGNRWTTHFIQDMQRLNIRPPDAYPRASAYIEPMHAAIRALLDAGKAYESNGSVYYAAHTWSHFGELSGIAQDELLNTANQHGNQPDDPHKRHPLDFPLWQAQQPGEPAWPSPWGPGRPGWHMECSTMALSLLGESVDFHGGGSDLMFPHHECEIAQAEPVTGVQPFVHHWFHAAMVEHEGEKMSKSLGNLIMVRDLLEAVSADALRLYLARQHYRRPWSFSRDELHASAAQADRWSRAATAAGGAAKTAREFSFDSQRVDAVLAALANDLNTPAAIDALDVLAQDLLAAAQARHNLKAARHDFIQLAGVLGMRLTSPMPEPRVRDGWQTHLAEFEDF